MTNRINGPDYAGEVALFKDTALSWFLNESQRATFVDENVPLADSSDIPRDLDVAEREMLEYFDRKVKSRLENPSRRTISTGSLKFESVKRSGSKSLWI